MIDLVILSTAFVLGCVTAFVLLSLVMVAVRSGPMDRAEDAARSALAAEQYRAGYEAKGRDDATG